jgi:hypothetical protein
VKGRVRFEVWSVVVNVGALAVALVAISRGMAPHRLRPAAGFLFASSAAAIYVEAVVHLCRRRARAQQGLEVPHGVRLRRPIWMSVSDSLSLLGLGASAGAVAAAAGFLGVGLGIMLMIAALTVAMAVTPFGTKEGLTLESDGLRVHVRGTSFLVPWKAVTGLDRSGSEQNRLLLVGIDDIRPILSSVRPDTARMRFRARIALGNEPWPSGQLTLVPWTAGIDGPVLARAINQAIERQVHRVN